jgi:hypothetical protein
MIPIELIKTGGTELNTRLRLALSNGPHGVGATPFLPEDRSRASFQNVFKEKTLTMDKVQKQDSSKCITLSSEPFRIEYITSLLRFGKKKNA